MFSLPSSHLECSADGRWEADELLLSDYFFS